MRNTLQINSAHYDDVSVWQMVIGLLPDGIFGQSTRAETMRYQERHGLKPDGIVGPITWQKAIEHAEEAVKLIKGED